MNSKHNKLHKKQNAITYYYVVLLFDLDIQCINAVIITYN